MPWHTRTRRSNQWYDTVRAYVGEGSGPHSSTLAWKIPWMEEPGRLQSMGSQRVGHDWTTSVSLFTLMHWRRKWRPTPVFLPGEPQGRGSLVGCRRWGRTESGTTEATQQQQRICWICPLFFKCFFCIHSSDCGIFHFYSIDVMSNISWYLNEEPALYTWDKSHLFLVYRSHHTIFGFNLLMFCWFLHLCSWDIFYAVLPLYCLCFVLA